MMRSELLHFPLYYTVSIHCITQAELSQHKVDDLIKLQGIVDILKFGKQIIISE